MKRNQNSTDNNFEEETIDIIGSIKKIYSGRKLIFRTTTIFLIFGIVTALLIPRIYESSITFVPQTADEGNVNKKSLGSLASLAGISLETESSSSLDSYLSPLLYSRILKSDEFSMELIYEKFISEDGKQITIKDYMNDSGDGSFGLSDFLSILKKYTIGWFTKEKKDEINNNDALKDFNFISEEDSGLIENFKQKFYVEVNEKEGYIKVSGYDKKPVISAQIVKLVTKNLQSKIISLRTDKIKEELKYSEQQYERKKNDFELLQNDLAKFKDSNKNISSQVFLAELEKIQSEFQIQQNILMNLATQYNNNKIKLNKNTPIFSILDDVSVPIYSLKPKRKQIVIIFIILGILLSSSYLLFENRISELIKEFN